MAHSLAIFSSEAAAGGGSSHQMMIPGGGFINMTGTNEQQIPAIVYVNETQF